MGELQYLSHKSQPLSWVANDRIPPRRRAAPGGAFVVAAASRRQVVAAAKGGVPGLRAAPVCGRRGSGVRVRAPAPAPVPPSVSKAALPGASSAPVRARCAKPRAASVRP